MKPDTYRTTMPREEITFRSELFRRMDRQDQDLKEIKEDGKKTSERVGIQNGRMVKIEEWSNEAKVIIENTTKIANETAINYRTDKTRIWAVITVLIFLGGTIITLAIMAIDAKIKEGITEALSKYEVDD